MQHAGIATPSDALLSLSEVPIEIVHWPEELNRDVALAREGRLRLLLVDPSATPPSGFDPQMDWIRLPAADEDFWRRVVGLQHRVRQLPAPELDEYGILRRGASWVTLAPIEARIAEALLEKPGRVCSRERLTRSAWPDGTTGEPPLSAYIKRVRRRVAPLGLAVHTVRRRGYFLEVDPQTQAWS